MGVFRLIICLMPLDLLYMPWMAILGGLTFIDELIAWRSSSSNRILNSRPSVDLSFASGKLLTLNHNAGFQSQRMQCHSRIQPYTPCHSVRSVNELHFIYSLLKNPANWLSLANYHLHRGQAGRTFLIISIKLWSNSQAGKYLTSWQRWSMAYVLVAGQNKVEFFIFSTSLATLASISRTISRLIWSLLPLDYNMMVPGVAYCRTF